MKTTSAWLENISEKISLGMRFLLPALSAAFILIFLVLAILRIQYPFELEWMEGGSVDHVVRLIRGLPLYCEPTLDFVPYRYTPLYYYVSYPFALTLGIGFVPLRLVSILATVGCLLILFLFVKKETGSTVGAAAAAGFFAATYPDGGAWFDVARVDMLFLFLLLASVYILRFFSSSRSVILSALLISLSFTTKQAAMLTILPVGLCYLVGRRYLGVIFACTVAFAIVVSSFVLDYLFDGWYYYYVFELGRHLVYTGSLTVRLMAFLAEMILRPYPGACLLGAVYLVRQMIRGVNLHEKLFVLASAVGLTACAFLLWISAGSWANNLIPGHLILALLFGLGLAVSLAFLDTCAWAYRRTLQLLIYVVCVVQLATMAYNPEKHLPSQADLEAGNGLLDLIGSFEGEVLVPFHSFIPTMAGKQSHANRMAVNDVINRTNGKPKEQLLEDIRKRIRTKRYSAIIIDHRWFEKELRASYDSLGPVFDRDDVFWPVTGWWIRPQTIWIPKPSNSTDTLQYKTADGQSAELKGKR